MRLVLLSLAAAGATLAATPALANEARVEARGGVIWNGSDSEAIAGVAAGYDVDLGEKTFVGVEVSGDKILTDHTRVSFGASARAGAIQISCSCALALACRLLGNALSTLAVLCTQQRWRRVSG